MDKNRQGIAYALTAYLLWGAFPLYFKMLKQVPALDILCHRVIWSFALLAFILLAKRQLGALKALLHTPRKILLLFITSILIAANWGTYIWAVTHDHMLDASLGYFINPLMTVGFGVLFLKEKLAGKQWLAIALAAIGVMIEVIQLGTLPWVALVVSITFALYGLLRKKINVEAQTGLFVETLILLPVALLYLFSISEHPTADLAQNSANLNLLLMLAGVITTVPLLFFTAATTKVSLSVLGFIQYITPSIVFLMAIFMYNEPLIPETLFTFGCIWLALIIFSIEVIQEHKKRKNSARSLHNT